MRSCAAQIVEVNESLDLSIAEKIGPILEELSTMTYQHATNMTKLGVGLETIVKHYEDSESNVLINMQKVTSFQGVNSQVACAANMAAVNDYATILKNLGATPQQIEAIVAAMAVAGIEPGPFIELALIVLCIGYGLTQFIPTVVNYIESIDSETEDSASAGSQAEDDTGESDEAKDSKAKVKYGSDVKSKEKLERQMQKRGWSKKELEDVVDDPYTTRKSTNKANGNPATVYYNEEGGYVIVDDVTNEVVQVSDNINPQDWIPDPSIDNPYIPGGN